MSLGISKAKLVGFVSAFVLLLISYALLFIYTNKLSQQALWMDHTNKVITNLEYLGSEYKSLEMNYRGFMGNRQPGFRTSYDLSLKHTDSLYKVIKQLTVDNPVQQLELDSIRSEIDHKVELIKIRMDSAGPKPPDILLKDFLEDVGTSAGASAPIIKQIRQIEQNEGMELQDRADQLRGFNNAILTINVASLLIALILAGYSIITYLKENQARQHADEKSEEYKKELEKRVKELASANKEIIELRNVEKFTSIGRIARTIAHEVRNPLTNINLAAEQLKESNPVTEDNTMLLDMVKRNGLRINQLISDLLNATKFSELKFEKASLNELIDKALELAQDRVDLKHISIEKDYGANTCNVTVDEEKMKIAFLNIIVNALEAVEPNTGILKITTEHNNNKCKIHFEDNGPGMNEETASKLFEPFFTNKERGNGLGLTNTQNIILNHKGQIAVESTQGKGTIFTVILDA